MGVQSSTSSLDTSLRILAIKCYKDDSGLVSIFGWRKYAVGRTIRFTVTDECTQRTWVHVVQCSPKAKVKASQACQVTVPRSSMHNRISVTAELLREDAEMTSLEETRHFEVESSSTCVAMTTRTDIQQELLSSLNRYLPSRKSQHDRPLSIPLAVERESYDRATLCLTRLPEEVTGWMITVNQTDVPLPKFLFLTPVIQSTTKFHFPVVFEAGRSYHIEVVGLDRSGRKTLCQNTIDIDAVLTLSELGILHQRAVVHVSKSGNAPCIWLYRNKTPEYFDNIIQNRGGLMEVYMKDNSGDPGSPINDRIQGLFFMASVKPGSKAGQPVVVSPFGRTRLLVPAEELLLTKAPNLYFADFYCMRGQYHYVTLVMTRPGSEADQFCSAHLLSLSVHDRKSNPFLFYDASGKLKVSVKKHLLVELLFTEDLDIRGYQLCQTPIVAKGHSTEGGRPKNPNCLKCNLPSRQTTDTDIGVRKKYDFSTPKPPH